MKSLMLKTKNGSLSAGFLALTSLAVLASACGGLSQDPFAGKADEIRENLRPVSKPTPGPTPHAIQMHIDTKDFFVFDEQKYGEEMIRGRILTTLDGEEPVFGKNFYVRIENLSDFPGATYDSTTGRFSWTPARGAASGSAVQVRALNLILETKKGLKLGYSKSIPVHVRRADGEPTITAVDDLAAKKIREGDRVDFDVTVRDADSSLAYPPKVLVYGSGSGSQNVAPHVVLVSGPHQNPNDPTLWSFEMRLDLYSVELTSNKDLFKFLLIGVSRYGYQSMPKVVEFNVLTKLNLPEVSWLESYYNKLSFEAGKMNRFNFSVYDPRNEGNMMVNFDKCPSGAQCVCDSGFRAPAFCQLIWDVDRNQKAGDYTVEFTAENINPVWGEPSRSTSFTRRIKVTLPAPTPTPAPTATP